MTPHQLDAWRNRPLEVRAYEHCDCCSKLKEGVEMREAGNYYPRWSVKLKSCAGCFEAAKSKANAEAVNEIYGFC
jgi:hypothetical protein